LFEKKLAREVLDEAAKAADVGVTTDELDRIVHEAAIERDCYPSPLNYYEYANIFFVLFNKYRIIIFILDSQNQFVRKYLNVFDLS
jgi:hypothetical protein